MAIRPVVLVYQDLASPTVTPTTPDLNCLVVGPAYWIQDYYSPGTTNYADKADILLSTVYGALEGDPLLLVPFSAPAAVTAAEPPNNAVGAVLDGDSVKMYLDEARVRITDGTDGVTSSVTPNVITSASALWQTGSTKVLPGDRIVISDGTNYIARTVAAVSSDTSLTVTADVDVAPFTPGASQTYYIERRVNDALVDSAFVTTNGNAVTLASGVTLAISGQGNKSVSYAKVYEQYRSLRQDLVELDTVAGVSDITAKIGRIDVRNPLGAAVFVAYQNTTSAIQYIGVTSDDVIGHAAVRDSIASRPDVYAIVPITTDVAIFTLWKEDCVGLASVSIAEANGRPQRFRVVIGNGTLPTTKTLIEPSATGEALQLASSAPTAKTKIVLTGVASLITGGVIPGDILRVTVTSDVTKVATGDYTVASVTSATTLEVDVATPFAGAGTPDITCAIYESDGTTVRIASAPLTGVVTSAGDDLYLILKDPSGTFVSSGIAAGDLVKIPLDPNATITATSTFVTLVVEAVISEQRLRLVNNGPDSSSVVNELPHGVKRQGGALVTTTAINYKIVRTLSKSQQVTELVAVAQSLNSKRAVLVWPDKVDVAGVTGGSKQPGYYLAAAVGGMTSGLPSQQGFTNYGIAGVSQIYDSNTYFTDEQLTDLSNGGWYVFAQQTPASLPYTIHQLTTDPSTLETGEYSVVKNFDFVSMFFVDILEGFIGQYNVTQETLALIQSALSTGGELLMLRTVTKIGAPLTSFAINDIGVSTVSGDRVITHIAIGLPKPLNVIELHLVA